MRSIVHDHGNLIDRHTIMARIAISGAYKDQLKLDWSNAVRSWFELKYFDVILILDSLKRWLTSTYLQFKLKRDGLSNDMLKDIINPPNHSYDYNA